MVQLCLRVARPEFYLCPLAGNRFQVAGIQEPARVLRGEESAPRFAAATHKGQGRAKCCEYQARAVPGKALRYVRQRPLFYLP